MSSAFGVCYVMMCCDIKQKRQTGTDEQRDRDRLVPVVSL